MLATASPFSLTIADLYVVLVVTVALICLFTYVVWADTKDADRG